MMRTRPAFIGMKTLANDLSLYFVHVIKLLQFSYVVFASWPIQAESDSKREFLTILG